MLSASLDNEVIQTWDMQTGEALNSFSVPGLKAPIAITHDSQSILYLQAGVLIKRPLKSSESFQVLNHHKIPETISRFFTDHNGRYIIAITNDYHTSDIFLYDLLNPYWVSLNTQAYRLTNTTTQRYTLTNTPEMQLAISTDGNKMVSTHSGGKKAHTRVWNLRFFNEKAAATAYKKVDRTKLKPLNRFITSYAEHLPTIKQAKEDRYTLLTANDRFSDYRNFIEKFPHSLQAERAKETLYRVVKKRNTLAGYEWFIEQFPDFPNSNKVIQRLHTLAFEQAHTQDTLTAYNDFILQYPYAKEISEALKRSAQLEARFYTQQPTNTAIQARLLAVRIKKLSLRLKQQTSSSSERIKATVGYQLIIKRMSDLLTEHYESTDAALRYYESKEFTDFSRQLHDTLADIQQVLANIEQQSLFNSIDLQELLALSKTGFIQADISRNTHERKAKQHRKWNNFMNTAILGTVLIK